MSYVAKFLKLNGDSGVGDILKFLLANTSGRFSSICLVILGALQFVAPELPDRWKELSYRAMIMVGSWILAQMVWRGVKNQQLLVTALAQKQIADPALPSSSPDPVVNREIKKQLNGHADKKE